MFAITDVCCVARIEDCYSIEDKLIELSIMPLDPVDE
jgi:hypothetical protein